MTGTLDPKLFASAPSRDDRFTVKDVWADMTNLPEGHPDATREFLHRQMNEEVNSLEISARNLVDFADAPWELRMSMARQCWDEARHIELFRREMEARGGTVGQYPVMNFQYRIITRIDSLVGRLAVQNRSFEAAGIDAIQSGIDDSEKGGDDVLAALFEMQLADEVQHVRYANVWVKKLTDKIGAKAVIDLARAVAQASEALKVIAGKAIVSYPVAEEIRREAGFTEMEIEAARQLTARA